MDTIVKALNAKVDDGNATTIVEALKQIDSNATGETVAEVIENMEIGGGIKKSNGVTPVIGSSSQTLTFTDIKNFKRGYILCLTPGNGNKIFIVELLSSVDKPRLYFQSATNNTWGMAIGTNSVSYQNNVLTVELTSSNVTNTGGFGNVDYYLIY